MGRRIFTPVYRQVMDLIRTHISEGHYRLGELIDSERVLASRFNVARMTVVRAVRELIDQGVLFRQPGRRGTFVHTRPSVVNGLGTPEAGKPTIGLCFLDVYSSAHPYFSHLITSLTDQCTASQLSFSVYSLHAGDIFYQRECALMRAIRAGDLSGLLLAGRMKTEDIFGLNSLKIPYLWINHEIPGETVPAVLVDYTDGAFSVVRYLVELGHRRIALLLGTAGNRASYESLVGFKLGLRSAGVPFDETLVSKGYFDEKSGYRMAKAILTATEHVPTALYAVDDLIACGAMKAAHELNVRVPQDISIVGTGNLVSEYGTTPALTTLEIHLEKVAQASFDLLRRIGAGNCDDDLRMIFRPELIVRGSSGPANAEEDR